MCKDPLSYRHRIMHQSTSNFKYLAPHVHCVPSFVHHKPHVTQAAARLADDKTMFAAAHANRSIRSEPRGYKIFGTQPAGSLDFLARPITSSSRLNSRANKVNRIKLCPQSSTQSDQRIIYYTYVDFFLKYFKLRHRHTIHMYTFF